MLDKQKLLQWIEDKQFVYSEPYEESDTVEKIVGYKNVVMILRVLKRDIDRNEFETPELLKQENGEEVKG